MEIFEGILRSHRGIEALAGYPLRMARKRDSPMTEHPFSGCIAPTTRPRSPMRFLNENYVTFSITYF